MVEEDPRVGRVLRNMDRVSTEKAFSAEPGERLTAEKVQEAADRNMPLCMRHLHSGLRRDHKLKHWGRLQYGLFLKGAGLDLEQALLFFEGMFAKLMSRDEFLKKHGYGFRHMYGKEGARKNYTPYSCMKIIMGAPPEQNAYHVRSLERCEVKMM